MLSQLCASARDRVARWQQKSTDFTLQITLDNMAQQGRVRRSSFEPNPAAMQFFSQDVYSNSHSGSYKQQDPLSLLLGQDMAAAAAAGMHPGNMNGLMHMNGLPPMSAGGIAEQQHYAEPLCMPPGTNGFDSLALDAEEPGPLPCLPRPGRMAGGYGSSAALLMQQQQQLQQLQRCGYPSSGAPGPGGNRGLRPRRHSQLAGGAAGLGGPGGSGNPLLGMDLPPAYALNGPRMPGNNNNNSRRHSWAPMGAESSMAYARSWLLQQQQASGSLTAQLGDAGALFINQQQQDQLGMGRMGPPLLRPPRNGLDSNAAAAAFGAAGQGMLGHDPGPPELQRGGFGGGMPGQGGLQIYRLPDSGDDTWGGSSGDAAAAAVAAAAAAAVVPGGSCISQEPSNKLFVGNIGWWVTEEDLLHWFSRFGSVVNVKIMYNSRKMHKPKDKWRSREYGFIDYASAAEAAKAIAWMDGVELPDLMKDTAGIIVQYAKPTGSGEQGQAGAAAAGS
ncbi:hypothetical protein OEZ85_009341 [Tetradesmus obliquus]|uniref:RRM domain-containing protein n=1 Tax=Tetradesmus obliquus TaxID=3088 RepID=A0ABY8U946_TETOB|nr:hypothetical protein OEZ85_009341 [Tetradesmus obliquus]